MEMRQGDNLLLATQNGLLVLFSQLSGQKKLPSSVRQISPWNGSVLCPSNVALRPFAHSMSGSLATREESQARSAVIVGTLGAGAVGSGSRSASIDAAFRAASAFAPRRSNFTSLIWLSICDDGDLVRIFCKSESRSMSISTRVFVVSGARHASAGRPAVL